ncbi:RES family NAD+ phosphorylase [Methylosinus sp. Sm6]|uniref:RES family NAD+ phosphorylase n=1 Tax=Methylosinus sp. Sm6 TaxID=2866948 RepID=UPI001C9A1480|nr:RES family NAD+ phosphorylase [Methylosinus sp. Sm6]MBY6242794.1 RES family NAD+ phosphorylase [Methylosinus sp. Sm6]
MATENRKARDLQLLDAIDAFPRDPFEGRTWRVAPAGRDPTLGGPSQSRWCNGAFDVLYTSLERDGAISEVHALLSLQPVFPSKPAWFCFELAVRSTKTLRLADLSTLQTLGVEAADYPRRNYERTQSIADAAFFLGFDGVVTPSARWPGANLILFTSRLEPASIELKSDSGEAIDWKTWKRRASATES